MFWQERRPNNSQNSLDPFLNPLIQNEEFIFSKKGLLHLFCISYTGLSPVNCQAMNLVQNPWKN